MRHTAKQLACWLIALCGLHIEASHLNRRTAGLHGRHVASAGTIDIDLRTRQQWQELEKICSNRNYTTCDGMDKTTWTNVSASQFSPLNFNGLGAWSTFTLTTYDSKGARRTRGGDSWYIVLRDRRQRLKLPTRVYDEGDGTYTVAVFLFMPGDFNILAWLWYSDCHGLQEPGERMEFYEKNLMKKDHCYVGGTILKQGIIKVDPATPLPPCMAQGCTAKPAVPAPGTDTLFYRMETYYFRQNHSYFPTPCCKPSFPRPSVPTSRFLFYGDSTVKNSWELLVYMARQPCQVTWQPRMIHELFDIKGPCKPVQNVELVDPALDKVLKRCTAGANWTTVPIGTNTWEVSRYHPLSMLFDMRNFTYNDTFARTHQPPVQLPLPREFTFVYIDGWGCRGFEGGGVEGDLTGVRPGDVLVVNIGAHCSRTQPFWQWKIYMNKVAGLLKKIKAETGALVVWRTSFMMKEHVFRSYSHADGYVPQAHFNTEHRRLIFDSYAEHVLVPIGVHIWDVYGMSAMGDYRPHDMVHTDGATTWAMNFDMMDVFGCFEF